MTCCSQNFTNCLMMGAKHLTRTKEWSHAINENVELNGLTKPMSGGLPEFPTEMIYGFTQIFIRELVE